MHVIAAQPEEKVIPINNITENMYVCTGDGKYLLKRTRTLHEHYAWVSLATTDAWNLNSIDTLKGALIRGLEDFHTGIKAFDTQIELIEYLRSLYAED